MEARTRNALFALSVALVLLAPRGIGDARAADTLTPFASEEAFRAQLLAWKKAAEKRDRDDPPQVMYAPMPAPAPGSPGEASPVAADAGAGTGSSELDSVMVTGTRIDEPATGDGESITNVQTAGVDEGGIVKHSGDFLVVLRRGRLFTVRVGGDALRPVAHVDAFAPGSDPDGTWYDEMLVSGSRVVVIGYSYDRGGSEVGLFTLGTDGSLSHEATYHLRSNDYYSSSNYASRLIGDTLVFYTPLDIDLRADSPDAFLPAMRRWHRDALPSGFRRLLQAQRIYRAAGDFDPDDAVLHTVTRCDLAAAEMTCDSTGVIGPSSRSFYVSAGSVYVWTTPWDEDDARNNGSSVFRMPLDGGAPTALRTSGSPIDQMGFLEKDDHLHVLVGSDADGEGMWRSRSRAGDIALLRVPLSRLGDGRRAAKRSDYRALPRAEDVDAGLHSRYIGDWLVYGFSRSWQRDRPVPRTAWAVRYADGDSPVQPLQVGASVHRVEAMGGDGILVGGDDDAMQFTSVRLDATTATAAGVFLQPGAEEGDSRTHGFFYRPTGEREGMLGLPVISETTVGGKDGETAGVIFLRNEALALRGIGQLDARAGDTDDDGCLASCMDWYGNARPIFLGQRIFGLLGYELVEGRIDGGRIHERRRADFTPPAKAKPR